MSLSCWVYVSRSLLDPAAPEGAVEDIVEVSRQRNARLGVTGALLHSWTRFAQRIEGPGDAIEELRSSILADPRHDRITTIEYGPCAARLFTNWSLAFSGQSRFFGSILEAVSLDGAHLDQDAVEAVALLFREFARPGPFE